MDKTVLLLANIGSRDLQLDGKMIKPARTRGEEIKGDLDKYKERLSTPILSPIIELIKGQSKNASLDVIFFCTNQEDEGHKENDTIFFGECLKQMWQGSRPITKIRVKEIRKSPNLYDEMFEFYETQLKRKESFDEYDRIYVGVTGGIPACNMALCLHSIKFFKERCVPVYTIEGRNKAISLQIGRQLLDDLKKNLMEEQIKNYEFRVASELLLDLGLKSFATLLKVCLYRLNFDFKRANELVEELINQEMGETRALCLEITTEIEELKMHKLEALISELYYNLQIKYKKGEYVDFLGRIFRFEEAVLRFVIEKEEPNITTDIDPDGYNFKNYQESLKKVEELIPYLETYEFEGGKLGYDKPNIPALLAILEFMIKEKDRGYLSKPCEGLKTLYKLTPLRNKSILGHGFNGVSLEDIKKVIPDFSLDYVEDILSVSGFSLTEDPFDKVNNFILQSMTLLI